MLVLQEKGEKSKKRFSGGKRSDDNLFETDPKEKFALGKHYPFNMALLHPDGFNLIPTFLRPKG